MLLIDAIVTQACPKGTDLTEVAQVGEETFPRQDGTTGRKPIYAGVYVAGLPFPPGGRKVEAPLDLQTGDLVRVETVERDVFTVMRKGKAAWKNEALHAAEELQIVVRNARQQAARRHGAAASPGPTAFRARGIAAGALVVDQDAAFDANAAGNGQSVGRGEFTGD